MPRPLGSVSGRCWGSASLMPSRLHTRTRSSVRSGRSQHRAELGQHPPDGRSVAHGDDHEWDVGVAREELRALAHAVRGPVDPEQHRRAGQSVLAQRLDDRHVRRPAAHAVLAADVDGELGRLMQLVGELDRADASREHAGALERHEAVGGDRCDVVEGRLDALSRVDRDRDDRQILRQRQQARGLEVVLDAEALDSAHHDAGLKRAPLVEVDERIGEKRAVRAVALPEVRRQLQAIVDHESTAP